MNDQSTPDLPQADGVAMPPIIGEVSGSSVARPAPAWWQRLLACNPFYLGSAALLLYGVYRVAVEPHFLHGELSQLLFNFSSLQVYEIVLVVTAIFLARRRLWYDSTLLAGLENLLVLVPFILVSQAALIDLKLVWFFCLAGGALVLARFGGLKRFLAELNFPRGLAAMGLGVLAVNVALPIVYRVLHESKFGTKPDWGAAYHANEITWLVALPLVCALVALLPPLRRTGELLPQGKWLPPGWLALWVLATGVHVYSLGYVYDFDFRPEFLAPALWVLTWIAWARSGDFLQRVRPAWSNLLLLPPAAVTVLAIPGKLSWVFLVLTILDVASYASLCFRQKNRLALQLLLISMSALAGGLPEEWGRKLLAEFDRGNGVFLAAAVYGLLSTSLSRNPRLGMLGAAITALAAGLGWGSPVRAPHVAAQAGFAYLLLHSLRWNDTECAGAVVVRIIIALVWTTHAWVWTHTASAGWLPLAAAVSVLAGYGIHRWFAGRWGAWVLPAAACLVMLASPGNATLRQAQTAPAGLLAIIGSFALFALGTVAALNRHRWHHHK